MPLFRYKAINLKGQGIKGIIDADSLAFAKDKLKREKIFITAINLLPKEKKQKIHQDQLLAFTREMSQLLNAGLPLYESLLTIEEKQKKGLSHAIFADLCDQVKGGAFLSHALSQYPESFSGIYLSMILSSEQSGHLAEAFTQLTNLIQKQQKLKKQLTAALAYPAILGGFCLLVIFSLFFLVIPSMQELFEGRDLHPVTQTVLSISKGLRAHGYTLLTAFCSLSVCLYIGCKTKRFKEHLSSALLKTPFVKKIILESALVRFCRAMHMLLSGGMPFVEALHFSKKTTNNVLLSSLISHVEEKMIEGEKISDLFAKSPIIPPLVVRMLSIGEETGNLSFALKNLAEIYEEELDRDLLQLTTFLQPAILLFLGVVVGLVVLSILLPLTDVSSFTSE